MGKPWFGIENYLWDEETQLSTSSSNSEYPVSNLGRKHLWPGWRSDRKPLKFDGVNDYLYTASHADLDIADTLMLYATFIVSDMSSINMIFDKLGATDGYRLYTNSEEKIVFQGRAGSVDSYGYTAPGTIKEGYAYRVIFYKSGTSVDIWINGQQSTTAGGAPASIGASGTDLFIGKGAGQFFNGYIFEAGIASYIRNYWHSPAITACKGYWKLDNWNGSAIQDSSGNGHHLTAVHLSSTDNYERKGVNHVEINGAVSLPDKLVLDRRHNLSSGATVLCHRSPIIYNTAKNTQSGSAIKNEPVVMDLDFPGTNTHFSIEFVDNSTSENSYEIPLVFLGNKQSLNRSYLRGFEHQFVQKGVSESAGSGSLSRYVAGEEVNQYTVTFYADAADRQVLEAAIRYCAKGYPVVFCPDDDEPEKTIFCHVEDPYSVRFRNVHTGLDQVELTLTEVS